MAVKVQYPGVGEAIRADLANADLLGSLMTQLFRGLDPAPLVAEIQVRIGEELDYRIEATNQQAFADFYRDHPFVHVPAVVPPMSTERVLTTELATGATWAELLTWDQAEKDLAAEAIFRFVFRSLYRFHAFNGDPHPGNYLFRPGGQVTFLDFGLVKHFDDRAMATFQAMIRYAVLEPDHARFRATVEAAGLLRAGAPVTTDEVGRYFEHFYEAVQAGGTITWTPGVRVGHRAPDVRPQLPHRAVRHGAGRLRHHPADQPGAVRHPRAAAGHRQLPQGGRGAVADGQRSAVDTDGRGRGGLAGPPVTQPGGGSVAARSMAAS